MARPDHFPSLPGTVPTVTYERPGGQGGLLRWLPNPRLGPHYPQGDGPALPALQGLRREWAKASSCLPFWYLFSLQDLQHVLLSIALLLSLQRDPALMVKGIKVKTSALVALRAGLSAKADPHSLNSDPEESEGAAARLP